MRYKTILLVLSTICLLACNYKHEGKTDIPEQDNIKNKNTQNQSNWMPYSPQKWIDNYLSVQTKDTLVALLWSEKQKRFLDSIPTENIDAISWYQDNEVELVLRLKNIEPLHIRYATSLMYCSILKEQEKTAIAIVPSLAQWSDLNSCWVYEITEGKWNLIKSFDILTSFVLSEGNEKAELTNWLFQKNGQWFYRDYSNYITEQDTDYHLLFEK